MLTRVEVEHILFQGIIWVNFRLRLLVLLCLTDYILTVAVSISSGVAQIVSAYPELYPYRVWIASGFVLFIMMINLRGVKESGITFAIPTYFFLIMMTCDGYLGIYSVFSGSTGVVINPPEIE